MGYTKKVKFEYYYVGYKKREDNDGSPDRPFDLKRWFYKINGVELNCRAKDYYDEKARLEDIEFDEITNFFLINFAKLRETNIPMKASENSTSVPIPLEDDEYIGEEVYALYDERNNVLMLQRNRYSITPTGVAEYINSTWENENEEIYLRPIYTGDVIKKAKRAQYYRKLKIRFADLPGREYRSSKHSPIKRVINSIGDFEPVSAEVVISLGHTRKNTLHRETVHTALDEIELNKSMISKAEISKKDTEDTRVEILDLFENKEHDYIPISLDKKQSLELDKIRNEMIDTYLNRRRALITHIKNRG